MSARILVFSFVLSAITTVAGFAQRSADVVVYDSTPGGFCAAITAARKGTSVIVLEPTEHVGGLSTGGLSHCDSDQMRRETLMGLFDEWHRRVVKDYTDRGLPAPYDPALKDNARWTFEPQVAMRVTMQILKESGVTVKTGRYLTAARKDGGRETKFTVDQTRPMPAGEHFQPIGTAVLAADVETTIQIKNMNTTGFVILDAVQLVPLK